ncbi:MAG: CPBP family intramembrane metalloprotease [Dehalococcoidia bacterium]|nr:CPBP family intramembrane metalloprotease [Dehalococcoidia bacterium]
MIFKILDVFVFHIDELLGEIIISKSLGFLLVVAYLWLVGKSVTAIGLHGKSLTKALTIGSTGIILILLVSYGLQFGVLTGAGQEPSLVLTAIDPTAGVTGGLAFALFLVVGNFVNSFMEEGLFRGVMLRHFRVSLSFWRANFLQAAFFGIWHLNWPIKQFMTGQLDAGGLASQSLIVLIATGIVGFAMGYLYLKTGSLWGPWIMHTINNTVQNMVHIQTIDGLDSDMMVFQITLTLSLIAIILFFRALTKRFQMSEVKPWGQYAADVNHKYI